VGTVAVPKPAPPPVQPSVVPPKPRVRLSSEVPTPEPKPVVTLPANAGAPKASSPGMGSGLKFQWRKPVTLTTSGFLLIGAGALVLVVLVWVGAYTLGSKDGEAKLLKDKGLAASGVTDPLKASQVPLNNGLVSPEPAQRQASGTGASGRATGKTSPIPSPVVGGGAPPSAKPEGGGTGGTGEITPGLNYCVAAGRLEKDAAERAAAFLRENGVGAAAVQVVEGQWSGAKNAGSWMVVVLKGITSKDYGARAAGRVEIETQLTKLGQVYRKDPKGRIDFGQFAWDKRK